MVYDNNEVSRCRLWCYGALLCQDELVGGNVTILMPPEVAEHHASYMERYLKTKEARVVGKRREVPGRTKDGRALIIEFLLQCTLDPTGKTTFVAVLNDITDIRRTVQMKETIFQATRSPMVVASEDGTILQVNGAVTEVFGYQKVSLPITIVIPRQEKVER